MSNTPSKAEIEALAEALERERKGTELIKPVSLLLGAR